MKLESKHEAASAYVEAAKCYQKTSKTGKPAVLLQFAGEILLARQAANCCADVLRALHKAVEYFTDMGRLSMAAKNLRVRQLLMLFMSASCSIMPGRLTSFSRFYAGRS